MRGEEHWISGRKRTRGRGRNEERGGDEDAVLITWNEVEEKWGEGSITG